RISSILTKGGVADAWSGEPESRRRIEAPLADSGMDAPMLAVSRFYLDRVLSHHLALSVERGMAPPLGLLQLAETLGGVDWQRARMDFGETLARLITEIPAAMRGGTAVETVLRKSDELADLEAVAQSWFEDGPDIARAIAGARARNRAKVVTYLLQSVIARHRDKWADLLLTDSVVDARGASRTRTVLARARDRCQGARRRAGHGRDRINARYRAAGPSQSLPTTSACDFARMSSSREAVQHAPSPPAEQATASKDQAWKSGTGDWAWDGGWIRQVTVVGTRVAR